MNPTPAAQGLLPCPFCGSAGKLYDGESDPEFNGSVTCSSEGDCPTAAFYIERHLWNRRANSRASESAAGTEWDWTEDFSHENGNYENVCAHCTVHFRGHKRRVVCKKCSQNKANPTPAPAHEGEPEEPQYVRNGYLRHYGSQRGDKQIFDDVADYIDALLTSHRALAVEVGRLKSSQELQDEVWHQVRILLVPASGDDYNGLIEAAKVLIERATKAEAALSAKDAQLEECKRQHGLTYTDMRAELARANAAESSARDMRVLLSSASERMADLMQVRQDSVSDLQRNTLAEIRAALSALNKENGGG